MASVFERTDDFREPTVVQNSWLWTETSVDRRLLRNSMDLNAHIGCAASIISKSSDQEEESQNCILVALQAVPHFFNCHANFYIAESLLNSPARPNWSPIRYCGSGRFRSDFI
jgi:hypothetical protein